MPRERCCHGREGRPCTCEMGNIYRFVEPIVLLSLARLGTAHGYTIAQEAEKMAVTHAGLDIGAVYRTLRRLEEAGHVQSSWETEQPGPARREYVLTEAGWSHLEQWTIVLDGFMVSLGSVLRQCREALERRKA